MTEGEQYRLIGVLNRVPPDYEGVGCPLWAVVGAEAMADRLEEAKRLRHQLGLRVFLNLDTGLFQPEL